jgi:hypothetical protein
MAIRVYEFLRCCTAPLGVDCCSPDDCIEVARIHARQPNDLYWVRIILPEKSIPVLKSCHCAPRIELASHRTPPVESLAPDRQICRVRRSRELVRCSTPGREELMATMSVDDASMARSM